MKEPRFGKGSGSSGRRFSGGLFFLSSLLVVLTLTACGGGGGGSSGAATPVVAAPTPIAASGTMTVGSVVLDDKHFVAGASSSIIVDDTPGHVEAELRDGMEVKLKGQLNHDRLTGQYDRVKATPAIRGAMSGKGVDDFTVLGQHVIVDNKTVFEDRVSPTSFLPLTFAGLVNTEKVEVHGGRDDLGNIHATRVERRGDNPADEVRGVVTAKAGTVISIGAFSVDINGVPTNPAGRVVNVGDLVEIHLNGLGAATLVDIEDAAEAEFEPAEGQEFEVEGFVTAFTATPENFQVGDAIVQTTATTKFENGVAADLMNGVKVEADGHVIGGVFVVEKISFGDSLRIEANADNAGSAGVLGKTIVAGSGTQLANLPGGVAGILAGDGLRIRGFLNGDNTTITATRIEKLSNPVAANQIIVQAPVSSFNVTLKSVTLIGITVDASGGAVEFQNSNDAVVTATTFFNSLVADRTVVKARGTFAATTLTANKVEVEKD